MNSANCRSYIWKFKKFQKVLESNAWICHVCPEQCAESMCVKGCAGTACCSCVQTQARWKYCAILYRRLEHPRILVSDVGSWNQSSVDTEQQLYLHTQFKNTTYVYLFAVNYLCVLPFRILVFFLSMNVNSWWVKELYTLILINY